MNGGRRREAGRKGRMEEAGGRKRKEAPYNPGQLSAFNPILVVSLVVGYSGHPNFHPGWFLDHFMGRRLGVSSSRIVCALHKQCRFFPSGYDKLRVFLVRHW